MKGHGRLILTAPEQGRYELQSNKLKPLDASKVFDQARVSVAEAKLDIPEALKPQTALPAKIQTVSEDHPVTGVTLSDGSQDPSSLSGSQVSLGDAARQSRKNKAAQDSSNNAAPVPH
jgi:hypothetical protein